MSSVSFDMCCSDLEIDLNWGKYFDCAVEERKL